MHAVYLSLFLYSYLKTTSCTSVSVAPILFSNRFSDCTGISSESLFCFKPSSPPVLREKLRCSWQKAQKHQQALLWQRRNRRDQFRHYLFDRNCIRTHLNGGNVEVLVEADGRFVSSRDMVQFCLYVRYVLFKQFHLEHQEKGTTAVELTELLTNWIIITHSEQKGNVVCVNACSRPPVLRSLCCRSLGRTAPGWRTGSPDQVLDPSPELKPQSTWGEQKSGLRRV